MARFELFHVIADSGSAQVRKFVMTHPLKGEVAFRNLFYPEVEADFRARGGTQPPALWDGQTLVQGADAVMERLDRDAPAHSSS